MIDLKLKGNTALITGASGTLGQHIAIALAKEGVKLLLHYNSSQDKIKNLTRTLDDIKCNYEIYKADFSVEDEVINMWSKIKENNRNVDILINNAGIVLKNPIVFISLTQYNKIFNINLKSQYILCKHILREMIKRKNGVIINISSSITRHSKANETAYGLSKGAIESFTRLLAKEVGAYNVRVNCVSPGPFPSDNNKLNYEKENEIINSNSIKKILTPKEIANIILFLCSDYSSAIVGQIINVDNGFEI